MFNYHFINRVFIKCLILTVFAGSLVAQNKRRQGTGNGTISGKVIDKENSSPLKSATVQVLRQRDSSLVKGAETDDKGEFKIDVPFGRYKLKISFITYSTAIISGIMINPQNTSYDAETVSLNPNTTTTDEIEVTAERELMEIAVDKKIFNVEKSIVTEGGTATDVLKNIPSVTVDADGNVSLRGSTNVKFLVNGKQSGLIGDDPTNSLQQIPASTIDRVEIIDNPSAKYDPEGTSGIINLVLKKPKEIGYNGNFMLNGGTEDKYNTSLYLNYKTPDFNLYGNYSFRFSDMNANSVSNRQNNFADSIFDFDQISGQRLNFKGHMGTLGFDYNLSDNNILSLSGGYHNRDRSITQTLKFQNLDAFGNLNSQYFRNNAEDHTGNGGDISLSFDHKFKKPKQDLNASFYFSYNTDNSVLNIYQQDLNLNGIPLNNTPLLQNTYTDGRYSVGTLQVDYYNPLGDNKQSESRYELGYKGTLRTNSSNFNSETYDYLTNSFKNDVLLDNDFQYTEQIHSLYGLYANNINDFKYQFGLRLEEALTNPYLITTNQNFNYNYFSAYPSFYISQKFLTDNEVQLNYSRRVNRPRLFLLNPFINYSDPYNLTQGNPYLKPEYINSFQFSYIKYFSSATILTSVFYKQVNDMISRITTVYPTGVSLTTFENLNSAKSYGVELTSTGHPFKWWSFNANFTYFRMIINGNDPNAALNNDNYSYTGKLITNLTFPDLFDFQIAYNYQGPTVFAQGKNEPVQSFDVALKKNFLDNKGSIGFRVSDLFNQLKYSSETEGPGFVQYLTRVRDSRVAYLTFSYRFGSTGKKQQTRKEKPKPENEDEDENGY